MLVDDCNHLKIVDFGSAQIFTPGQPLNIEHIQGLSESKGNDEFFVWFQKIDIVFDFEPRVDVDFL